MLKRSRAVRTAVLVFAVAAAALAAGCTGGVGSAAGTADPPGAATTPGAVSTAPIHVPQTQTPRARPPVERAPTATKSLPRPRAPVDRAPTATESLAAFFAAARADDARIRAAARAVNREIGPTSVRFSRVTLRAVEASTPDRTARALPAGMPADLLRATTIVYSDLATRSSALNPTLDFIGIEETRPRTDPDVVRFLDGLHRAALIARAYPADLAAARALAAATAPIEPVAPDSRAAAELAIRVAVVKLANGCNGGNPPVLRDLVPIVWTTTITPDGRGDGSIGGLLFHVAYAASSGWTVRLDAC